MRRHHDSVLSLVALRGEITSPCLVVSEQKSVDDGTLWLVFWLGQREAGRRFYAAVCGRRLSPTAEVRTRQEARAERARETQTRGSRHISVEAALGMRCAKTGDVMVVRGVWSVECGDDGAICALRVSAEPGLESRRSTPSSVVSRHAEDRGVEAWLWERGSTSRESRHVEGGG